MRPQPIFWFEQGRKDILELRPPSEDPSAAQQHLCHPVERKRSVPGTDGPYAVLLGQIDEIGNELAFSLLTNVRAERLRGCGFVQRGDSLRY
jgi:hypothetical protein